MPPGALQALAPAQTPFDRGEWWQLTTEAFHAQPLYALAQDDSGTALLPLMVARGRLEALSSYYTFRVAPVLSPGAEAAPLLTALARGLRRHGRITLWPLPDEKGEASTLARALRAAGWWVEARPCDINHILPVAGRGWDEYLTARPGPLRTTLKRKGKKVAVSLHHALTPQLWSAWEAIYQASWKPDEFSPTFWRHFAEQEAAAGRLRMALAHHDGQPVAAQLWTVEAGTAFIHKLAYREDAAALSPGTTLTAALMRQVIEQDRVDLVDFGTGDDAYKRDWMEAQRPRYRIDAIHPLAPRLWPHAARHLARWLAGRRSAF